MLCLPQETTGWEVLDQSESFLLTVPLWSSKQVAGLFWEAVWLSCDDSQ